MCALTVLYIIMLLLESQQQAEVRAEAEQSSVYHASPAEATSSLVAQQSTSLHEGLTAANYKSRFRTLIYLETEQIENRLSTDVGK